MPESQEKSNKFWKGLKDYYDDPEILKAKVNEFNDGVSDDFDTDQLSGISRRKFLALLTASAAFTATACTDYRDKGEIVPYTKRPEEIIPGKANYYASTCKGCSLECGVLIKTREGRPIKIDGNPEHPINKGKICSVGQASILNLYDPERLTNPTKNKNEISWNVVDKEIIDLLKNAASQNKKIAIVSNKINSPTSLKVLEKFKEKYPTSEFYFYELFGDNTKRNAWEKCYGTRNTPSVNIDKADVIVSLDSDFLSREGNFIENTRFYASRKDIMKSSNFSKLFSVEGGMSLTGMNADVRIKLKPEFQHEFVLSILNEIILVHGIKSKYLNSNLLSILKKYDFTDFISKQNLDKKKVHSLVESLMKNQGKSIVIAGDSLSEKTHIAVNLLNEVLNNSSADDFISVYAVLVEQYSLNDLMNQTSYLPRKEKQKAVTQILKEFAAEKQQAVLTYLENTKQENLVSNIDILWAANTVVFTATPQVIYGVANNFDEVAEIRYDPVIDETYLIDSDNKLLGSNNISDGDNPAPQQGLILINAPAVWAAGDSGKGVLVANLDTGCDWDHPDLIHNIWNNLGEDSNGNNATVIWNGSAWVFDPGDINGIDDDSNGKIDDFIGWDYSGNDNDPYNPSSTHGTKTSGIVCGDGTNGTQTGVAPKANIMILRPSGESQYWLAQQYAIDNGADVITSSLSYKWYFSPQPNYPMFRQMTDVELAAGVVHTNSTSNDGNNLGDRKSTRLNSSHTDISRMPSSA